ncbi:MAG: nucleotidyltransferase domain-containing protein [Bacteroidales bacterium]|jgi:predicted nucleotidyltransferase|nr:nucleotidyltransferase domain-containing protein [Bacteroidales bacterium]
MKKETRIMVNRIREVLVNEPVQKAWLFGSYARGQEGPESDVDLLVQMAPNDLTILGFLKIQTRLEKVTNKSVDLIEDECLEDFARPSAENDKILIYESAR